jgi:Rieske Fe-S protein
MTMNRREFMTVAGSSLALVVGGTSIALCVLNNPKPVEEAGVNNALAKDPFSAGPIEKYAKEGVYDDFAKSKGVWIVSDGKQVVVFSGTCTHAGGVLVWTPERQVWVCQKHQAEFTSDGTNKPDMRAKRPLERCSVSLSKDAKPEIQVDPTKLLRKDKGDWDKPEASVKIPA